MLAEKTCIIRQWNEKSNDLIIPEYIDGYRVTGIEKGIFADREFRDVVLPESLTEIRDVFMASTITGKLIIKSSIISPYAFWMSKISGQLILPENLSTIGDFAFYGSTFGGKLLIPKNVESIGEGAFSKCTELKSIEFASGSRLKKICKFAFAGCENLSCDIRFPFFLEEIGERAFFDTDIKATIYPNTKVANKAFDKLINV